MRNRHKTFSYAQPSRQKEGLNTDHVSALNRATTSRPIQHAQSLLRIQRDYGNRCAQRALSEQGTEHPHLAGLTPLVQPIAAPALVQRETAPPRKRRVPRAKYDEDLNAILPRGVGPLVHIDRTITLANIFTEEALAVLARRVRSDTDLTRFVQRYGVPGLVALFDARLNLAKAQKLLQKNRQNYSRDALRQREQSQSPAAMGETLGRIESWAKSQARHQAGALGLRAGMASPTWVRDLATTQRQNVRRVTDQLQDRIPMIQAGAIDVRDATSAMARARDLMNSARQQRQSVWAGLIHLSDAADAIAQAHDLLIFARYRGIGGLDQYIRRAHGLATQVKRRAGQDRAARTIDRDALRDLRDKISELRLDIRNNLHDPTSNVKSLQRIIFVLRYFLALNDPNSRDAPTLDEAKMWVDSLEDFSNDIERFFGETAWRQLSLFQDFAVRLEKQIRSRLAMRKALGREPGLVPSQQDAEAYFRSLRKRSNVQVRAAYEKYAGAFFQHRVVAAISDVQLQSAENVYGKPVTIVGTRLLVCGGYAILGSHLLRQASAKHVNFILGARVSRVDLLSGADVTDVHALAHLRRQSRDLYVSNDKIVFSASETAGGGFSRNELAWANRNNRLITGSGKTMSGAVQNLGKNIQKAVRMLRPRRRGR